MWTDNDRNEIQVCEIQVCHNEIQSKSALNIEGEDEKINIINASSK